MNNTHVYILDAARKLTRWRKEISGNVRDSIQLISQKVPIDDIDIVVIHHPQGIIPEVGIGGRMLDKNALLLFLDATRSDAEKVLCTQLVRILSHELYHCLWRRHHGLPETLGGMLIFEGLADHFEIEVTKQTPQPWARALSSKEITSWMKKAKLFFNKQVDYDQWFFGTDKIPRWTGYTLGFEIMRRHLFLHPDQRPSSLYSRPAKEFSNVV